MLRKNMDLGAKAQTSCVIIIGRIKGYDQRD